ncbi:MAG: hypothetical protein DI629_01460 [Mesorhizobium amorphae]|nr:MAG: hypothetical protein DI629_01460 [Mesorhizobium amorphae]
MRTSSTPRRFRSAETGRFVSSDFARRHPDTTLGERRGRHSPRGAFRSCATGRFVDRAFARQHPRSTIRHR